MNSYSKLRNLNVHLYHSTTFSNNVSAMNLTSATVLYEPFLVVL